MKERPILFSGPMVSAILDGRKTQTRRVVNPQPEFCGGVGEERDSRKWGNHSMDHDPNFIPVVNWRCPYGEPGTILLVKESAWMWCERRPNGKTPTGSDKWHYVPMREAPIFYAADHPKRPKTSVVSPDTGNVWGWRLKVARFLPAWAVRIRLVSTAVRVERLNDISYEDCWNEGMSDATNPEFKPSRRWFSELWESINGPGSWDANPWVWVVEFRRLSV